MNERVILNVRDLEACSRWPGGVRVPRRGGVGGARAFHVLSPPPMPATLFDGEARHEVALVWSAPDPAQQWSHANEIEPLRDGAGAVAIAAVDAQ